MVEIAVIGAGQGWISRELLAALREELTSFGVASIHAEARPSDPRPVVAVLAREPSDTLLGEDSAALARTILVLTESPGGGEFRKNLELYRSAGAVFATSSQSVRELRRAGLCAEHIQLGYTHGWDHFQPGADRDIDVLLIAPRTPRRERYLASYDRALACRARHLQLLGSEDELPDQWSLLQRARIMINVHGFDEPRFDWLDALPAIHCGCVLLSEHSLGYRPLDPGRHFFAGSAESLGLLADYLLEDDVRLMTVAQDAYDLIRERQSMAHAARRLATVAAALSAEGDGEGHHPSNGMKSPLPCQKLGL